jgi:WD domain, G-beta repeat
LADSGERPGPVWVGFDPAGRYVAAYRVLHGGDARLTVWAAARWAVVHDAVVGLGPDEPEAGPPAAFLPSGSHLVFLTRTGLGARPLGAARGEIKPAAPTDLRPARPAPASLWADPAGKELKRLRANGDWTVVGVDGTSPDKPGEFAGRREYQLRAAASALALSPDQTRLAWAERPPDSGQVVTVHLLDLGTGKEVRLKTAGPANALSRLAFSPDGKGLAAGGFDGSVRLWDVAAGKEAAVWRGPLFTVSSLAFSPDGARLAYGTFDTRGAGNVWLVSAKDGSHLAAWDAARYGVQCVAFDPKGERLAVAGGHPPEVKVYDVKQVLKK